MLGGYPILSFPDNAINFESLMDTMTEDEINAWLYEGHDL